MLDLSRVLAGPWASQLLGDLGAEVIKVERPGCGDDTRGWGPPYLRDAEGRETGEAAYFLSANRNKKSVTIDIASSKGRELARRLAVASDIVIENYKVGTLARYGLDGGSLLALKPSLIYCSITGFGQTGPSAGRAGYDFLIQAMGGLMSVTGRPDGEPGGGPQKAGVAVTDIMTGLYAASGVLAALRHRDRTGEGQVIDIALLDTQIAGMANQAMNYLTTGISPERMGNAHPNIVPYQDFPTLDGALVIAVGNDAQFRELCEVLVRPEWAEDARFSSNHGRVLYREKLTGEIAGVTCTRPTAHWVSLLTARGVPCGAIQKMADVFADAQVKARGVQVKMKHALAGEMNVVANPLQFSRTPVAYRSAPPLLGEHTREVLREILQVSEAELEVLTSAGVI